MAIRSRTLFASLLVLSAASPAIADVGGYGLRYRLGTGFGPGESISGSQVGYNKFVSGGAVSEFEASVAPVPAVIASARNTDTVNDAYAFGFLFYSYAVDFTAVNNLVLADLSIVQITGIAAAYGTANSFISANVNDGLFAISCIDGVGGGCGFKTFDVVGRADSYIETDQFDGTSIYTLFGTLTLNGNVVAAANIGNLPNYLSAAKLYLDPTIGLNNAFATTNNVNNVVVQLSAGVANATAPAAPFNTVPEPASWAMLITGFGLVGAVQRRRRSVVA